MQKLTLTCFNVISTLLSYCNESTNGLRNLAHSWKQRKGQKKLDFMKARTSEVQTEGGEERLFIQWNPNVMNPYITKTLV